MTDIPLLKRRSIRLRDYDYSLAGGYFVTMCTDDRQLLFAEPSTKQIVESAWNDLPAHHPRVEIDALVVMPNHVHAILFLLTDDGVDSRAQQAAPLPGSTVGVMPGSLGAIVRSLRATCGRRSDETSRSGSGTTTSTSSGMMPRCNGSVSTSSTIRHAGNSIARIRRVSQIWRNVSLTNGLMASVP